MKAATLGGNKREGDYRTVSTCPGDTSTFCRYIIMTVTLGDKKQDDFFLDSLLSLSSTKTQV